MFNTLAENLAKKIRRRIIFFIIFLILSVFLLIGTIIVGLTEEYFILPTMTLIMALVFLFSLIPTIIFGVSFSRLRKTSKQTENSNL